MDPAVVSRVHLRHVEPIDLPRLYEMNLDPESNRMAATLPRNAAEFEARWSANLTDPDIVARTIWLDNDLAGSISCFKQEGLSYIGYWIAREFWGLGIASRALELFLNEVPIRPLNARAATSNQASIRVLQKCGFQLLSVEFEPATGRYLECDVAHMMLDSPP